MRSSGILFCLAVCLAPSYARAGAGLEGAWSSAQSFDALSRPYSIAVPSADIPPVPAPINQTQDGDMFRFSILSGLPATDPKTAAWLASRIPGLDTAALKTVPEAPVDSILQRASAAKASYLDIFTDPGLGKSNPDLYYLSQGALDSLNRRWVSGTLPITGNTSDGRAFHMQALVAGRGAVYILYDLGEFQFKDGKNDFKIVDGGKVAVSVLGKADVGITGVKAHGCKGPFCAWVDVQRMTKTGPTTVHVHTNRGDQDAPLVPVHPR